MAAQKRDYFKLNADEAFKVDRTGAPLGELGISMPSLTDLTNFLANAKKVLSDTTKLGARINSIRAKIGKIKNSVARNNISQKLASAQVKFTTISKQLDIIRNAYSAATNVINGIKKTVGLRGLGLSPQVIALIPTVIKGISVLTIAVGALYTINRYLDMVEKDIAKQIEIEKIAAQREKTRTEQDIYRKQQEAIYEYYQPPAEVGGECPDIPEMSDDEYCATYPDCCEYVEEEEGLFGLSAGAKNFDMLKRPGHGLNGLSARDQRWDNVPHVRRIGVKIAGIAARNQMYDNKPEHQVARIQGLGSSSDQNRMNRRNMGLEKARDQRWDILRQARLGGLTTIMQKLKRAMTEAGI